MFKITLAILALNGVIFLFGIISDTPLYYVKHLIIEFDLAFLGLCILLGIIGGIIRAIQWIQHRITF